MTCTIKVIQVRNYHNYNNKIYYETRPNQSIHDDQKYSTNKL